MKILLVGNIANNSYNLAKFLRRRKVHADVLCYNFTHVMGQPEWEDADFEGEVDQYFPAWNQVDLKGFKRPEWFKQEVLILPALDPGTAVILPGYVKKIIKKIFVLLHPLYMRSGLYLKIPDNLKRRLKPVIYQDESTLMTDPNRQKDTPAEPIDRPLLKEMDGVLDIKKLVREFKEFFPWREDQLTRKDILFYYSSLPWFRRIFQKYDLIHAAATDPIYAMLAAPAIPYVAFEHGTLRDLPFENSPQGRLLSLAYKKAAKVIITNPDTLASAKKLGLDNYLFVPHPLDQEKYRPQTSNLHEELRKTHGVQNIIFSPARHDWGDKGNDLIIRGFAEYLKNTKKTALLIFTLWGQDIKKSRKLVQKLALKQSVLWIPILHEANHIKYINAADMILDQMLLPSFGGVAFKGMSCGKPVISSYRHKNNQWCLPEPPPLVTAYSAQEIDLRITELLDRPGLKEKIGQEGRDWIIKHHSWQLAADQMIRTYNEILKKRSEKGR